MTPTCADRESGIDDECEMYDDGVHTCGLPEDHLEQQAHECECGVTW